MSKKADKKKKDGERRHKEKKVFGARWRESKGQMILVWKRRRPKKYGSEGSNE